MVCYTHFAFVVVLTISKVLAGSDGDNDDIVQSFVELFKPENIMSGCCQTMDNAIQKVKDCKNEKEEWTCEDSQCVFGDVWLDDGEMDKAKARAMLDEVDKRNADARDMTKRIRRLCLDEAGGVKKHFQINNDDENYANLKAKFEDTCPAIKYHACYYINAIVECDAWKDTDDCKKMSEHAKKCKVVLDALTDEEK